MIHLALPGQRHVLAVCHQADPSFWTFSTNTILSEASSWIFIHECMNLTSGVLGSHSPEKWGASDEGVRSAVGRGLAV
jgi:hypothetical protein